MISKYETLHGEFVLNPRDTFNKIAECMLTTQGRASNGRPCTKLRSQRSIPSKKNYQKQTCPCPPLPWHWVKKEKILSLRSHNHRVLSQVHSINSHQRCGPNTQAENLKWPQETSEKENDNSCSCWISSKLTLKPNQTNKKAWQRFATKRRPIQVEIWGAGVRTTWWSWEEPS